MSHPPRMGRIEYLNVLPVYHALETGRVPHGYELVYGPPSVLNDKMSRGELVVASTSSIEYARRPEKYWIVPDIAIGGNGPVMSVLLLSRVPVADLNGKTVLVSAQTHTSAALLRLLLQDYAKVRVVYATGDAAEGVSEANPPDAVLTIGDEALRLRTHPAYPYKWDLSAAWREWTNLPFTFGLWVVNRQAAEKNALAEDPAKALHAGRDWGKANINEVLDVAEKRYSLSRAQLTEYFAALSYSLGEAEQKGLRLFYDRLAANGLTEKAPDLAFWPGS